RAGVTVERRPGAAGEDAGGDRRAEAVKPVVECQGLAGALHRGRCRVAPACCLPVVAGKAVSGPLIGEVVVRDVQARDDPAGRGPWTSRTTTSPAAAGAFPTPGRAVDLSPKRARADRFSPDGPPPFPHSRPWARAALLASSLPVARGFPTELSSRPRWAS